MTSSTETYVPATAARERATFLNVQDLIDFLILRFGKAEETLFYSNR